MMLASPYIFGNPGISALAGSGVEAETTTVSLEPPPVPMGTKLFAVLNCVYGGVDTPAAQAPTGWLVDREGAGSTLSYLAIFTGESDGTTASIEFGVDAMISMYGVIVAMPGATAVDDVGAFTSAGTSDTVTGSGLTPANDKAGVLLIGISQSAVAIRAASGYSGSSPSLAEIFDGGANSAVAALNLAIHIALGVQTTAAATGSRTMTLDGLANENIGCQAVYAD